MDQLSEKQLQANKQNAQFGGVKSDAGKNIVRFNARKHGVLAVLMTPYEDDLYNQFLDQLYAEFQPVGFIEEILVERIAVCYLRLYRSGKAEVEFMKTCFDPDVISEFKLGNIKDGYKAVIKSADIEKLQTIYMRYETTIENRMYRAIHGLERLQRLHNGEFVAAPLAIDVSENRENGFVSQNN